MTSISFNNQLPSRLRIVTISLVAWGGIATLFSLQRLYGVATRGLDPTWDRLALEMIITWGGWAVLTPLIFLIVRRAPLPSDNPRRILLHVPIGLGIGLLHSLIVATITPLFIWRPSLLPIRDMLAGRLASAIAFETLIYFMVAAVLYACIYATEARQRQIAFARAEAGLERARLNAKALEENQDRLASQMAQLRNHTDRSDSLAVPVRDGLVKIPVGSIDWLQAEDNYVRLHAGARSHLLRTTMSALEKRLAERDFVRIHRSAMVRVSRIARLKRISPDRYAVVLTTGAQLRVSRAYRKRVVTAVETPLTPH
jgi:DNA-binding LytR/AlgR family response regulator